MQLLLTDGGNGDCSDGGDDCDDDTAMMTVVIQCTTLS